jgi:3-phenylpropionate/trans-cinnamate dioxygenase ferredoxin reductase subunit
MEESTRYLLIGGGLASVWAAQNIRERDADGRILLVGRENHPPYDKPPLSKQYLLNDDYTAEDAYSKFDNFYPDNRIQLHTGVAATRIDRAARTVALDNGGTIRYEKLLLATGADPRRLDVPGKELHGIFYLRTVEDAEAIRTAMQHSRRAVLVGAGYLNMEAAAACAQRGLDTTVLEPASYPWSRFASPALGGFMRESYEARGVKFMFGEEVTAFEGNGSVSAVVTKSGARVAADFVVVAVGAALRTQLAQDAGLEIGDRGGVLVNEYLQTSDPNIWAAGDIACFQDVALGRRWHAEHHLNAKWQGRAAGKIMAGERTPYDQVPYFFSDFLDLHMIQRGDPNATHDTTVLGDLKGGEFVELYPDAAGALRMGIAISHEEKTLDPFSDKLEELIRAKANVKDLTAATFGL